MAWVNPSLPNNGWNILVMSVFILFVDSGELVLSVVILFVVAVFLLAAVVDHVMHDGLAIYVYIFLHAYLP
jgi:multisubunit Na+/H+ antiporter MnhG subunit